jgi:hypothetical protein
MTPEFKTISVLDLKRGMKFSDGKIVRKVDFCGPAQDCWIVVESKRGLFRRVKQFFNAWDHVTIYSD